jgi:hypothetical protein
MAQDRKAGDTSTASGKMRAAIPLAKKDDVEDVAWALQTAEATWSRGDRADALKWIRRAAEAASEAEHDDRALELAKAAADVASLLASPATAGLHAAESPKITTTSSPPPAPQGGAARGVAAPTPSRVGANVPSLPRSGQKSPTPPRVTPGIPASKRGGRRSSPSFTDETTLPGITAAMEPPRSKRLSATNETAKKKGRLSKPAADEIPPAPLTSRTPSSTDDIEAWPSTSGIEVHEDEDDVQHTRIGTPAYRQTAERASSRAPAPMPPFAPLVMSQAVRVVVWRGADGVHVAPAGTQVAAIGVEAILVAIDPVADLAAWLTNK